MALPDPEAGLVIRYSFLWHSQAQEGREEGSKDRPCVIVLAVTRAEDGKRRVMVAPITHTTPKNPSQAVEVPATVGRGLGLDWAKSWIVTAEVNTFTWPGPDVRAAQGERFAFGKLPQGLAENVRQKVFDRRMGVTKVTERDEKDPAKMLADIKRKRQLGDIDNDQGK